MYQFIGRWHDLIAASALTTIAIVTGAYLAYYYQPVWLNRAGSLIIIVGVILAVNRIHDIFEKRFIVLFDKDGDRIVDRALELSGKQLNRPLAPEQRSELKDLTRAELRDQLRSLTSQRKLVFRYFEVWLIVIGTFLNGFGDYLVCLFRPCSA